MLRCEAAAVRQKVTAWAGVECLLTVGLWLPGDVLDSLASERDVAELAGVLAEHRLECRTLNGFPQGDFHQAVVKHAVYEPRWDRPERLSCTIRLAEVLSGLLAPREAGSISTLPLGWRTGREDDRFFEHCAAQLVQWGSAALRIAEKTGRTVRLALEPEPGCLLERSTDVVAFFERWLDPAARSAGVPVRDVVGVCHDVCHAAVMGESQTAALDRFRTAGVRVFKVQVSSALVARFSGYEEENRDLAHRLSAFAEPRYLHQVRTGTGAWFEDLPLALESAERSGEWRIHFHMPLFVEHPGPGLSTTRRDVSDVLRTLGGQPEIDWEVETYAWPVLPQEMQPGTLAEGIAGEVRWFADEVRRTLSRDLP